MFPSDAAYNRGQLQLAADQGGPGRHLLGGRLLQFFEAALNLVLPTKVDLAKGFEIRLKDGKRISQVAYRDLLGGIRASGQLRQALLKETDDDDEWIPNPKQTRTSFPLLMDAQTFATWSELLGHMEIAVPRADAARRRGELPGVAQRARSFGRHLRTRPGHRREEPVHRSDPRAAAAGRAQGALPARRPRRGR
jgi:hypothetical protein